MCNFNIQSLYTTLVFWEKQNFQSIWTVFENNRKFLNLTREEFAVIKSAIQDRYFFFNKNLYKQRLPSNGIYTKYYFSNIFLTCHHKKRLQLFPYSIKPCYHKEKCLQIFPPKIKLHIYLRYMDDII